MDAKQKARDLVFYFVELLDEGTVSYTKELPKELGTKTVEEILKTNTDESIYGNRFSLYWNEVKEEIEYIKL
jgi:hypothetical protein